MKPSAVVDFLDNLIKNQIQLNAMIWGATGVGKSSVVKQVADKHGLEFIHLPLTQLSLRDLRGIQELTETGWRWNPPQLFPQEGGGILLFDGFNLATQTMQRLVKRLMLSRALGSYSIPDKWFLWATCNLSPDMMSPYGYPLTFGNQFIHLEIEHDLEDLKAYGTRIGMHPHILSFLEANPSFILQPPFAQTMKPAWPTPRSWEMASTLYQADLDITPAVGSPAATQFYAQTSAYTSQPDIQAIITGQGDVIPFPSSTTACYILINDLAKQTQTAQVAFHVLRWLIGKTSTTWVESFAAAAFPILGKNQEMHTLKHLVTTDSSVNEFLTRYQTSRQ